jgi:hypothetical protein
MTRELAHDRVISALAARQHGVVARWQLLAAGLPVHVIDTRLCVGRLLALHRGVYGLGHVQLRREGHWLAGVLALGPGAVLSHGAAAVLWDIWDGPHLPVHVTVAARGGRRHRRGLVVHRVGDLPTHHVAEHRGIPVTSVARTILDLAATVRGRRLEQVIRRASRLRRFDLCEQQAVVARLPRHRGAPELAQLLVGLAGRGTTEMRSRLEVGFAQLCDDHGLARPVVNGQVLGERVDFHWPGTTLVVETDGFEFHATPTTFADDRRRDQKLTLAGFTVVRLTWDQVMHETGSTAPIVARLLLQCRAR